MYSLISLTLLLSVAEKEDELKIGQNVNVTSGVQWRLLMSRPKVHRRGFSIIHTKIRSFGKEQNLLLLHFLFFWCFSGDSVLIFATGTDYGLALTVSRISIDGLVPDGRHQWLWLSVRINGIKWLLLPWVLCIIAFWNYQHRSWGSVFHIWSNIELEWILLSNYCLLQKSNLTFNNNNMNLFFISSRPLRGRMWLCRCLPWGVGQMSRSRLQCTRR